VREPYLRTVRDNYGRAAAMLVLLAIVVTAPRAADLDLERTVRSIGRVGMGLSILLIALVPGAALYTSLSRRARSERARGFASAVAGVVTLLPAVMIPASFGPNAVALVGDPTLWATIAALGAVCAFAGRRIRNSYRDLYAEFRGAQGGAELSNG
jgi:hypothetical protein